MHTQQLFKCICENRLPAYYCQGGKVQQHLDNILRKMQNAPKSDGEKINTGFKVAASLVEPIHKVLTTRETPLISNRTPWHIRQGIRGACICLKIPLSEKDEGLWAETGGFLLKNEDFGVQYSAPFRLLPQGYYQRIYVTVNKNEISNAHCHFFNICTLMADEGIKMSAKMAIPPYLEKGKDNMIFGLPPSETKKGRGILEKYASHENILDLEDCVTGGVKLASGIVGGYESRGSDIVLQKKIIGKQLNFSQYIGALITSQLFLLVPENEILTKAANSLNALIEGLLGAAPSESFLPRFELNATQTVDF
jgi:hypothetical protein